MKKLFLAIAAIMIVVCVASTGHTVVINGERQVGVSSQPTDYQQSEVTAKEFGALKRELRNYKKNQKARVDSIDNRLKVNEENVGILFSAHNGLVKKFNQLLSFSNQLLSFSTTNVGDLNSKLSSIRSVQDLLWFILKILILAGAVIGVVTLLRRRAS